MEFTDHTIPTETRYSEVSNTDTGNHRFMWGYFSRNISHPRDYFRPGYDPETGDPNQTCFSTNSAPSATLGFAKFSGKPLI